MNRPVSALLFMALSVGVCKADAQTDPRRAPRAWTIETSIGLRYFVDADDVTSITADPATRPIKPSPDGSRFAVLSRSGEIATDENVYELRIYDTAEVVRAVRAGAPPPAPIRILQRRSNTNKPAIANIRWAADSASLLFEGNDDVQPHPIVMAQYEFDLTQGITRLCHCNMSPGNGMTHLVSGYRGRALFVDYLAPPTPVRRNLSYPSETITAEVINRITTGSEFDGLFRRESEGASRRLGLFMSANGSRRLITPLDVISGSYQWSPVSGSMGAGAFAAAVLPASPAQRWLGYDAGDTPIEASGGNIIPFATFVRIRARNGHVDDLNSAPAGTVTMMGRRSPLKPGILFSADDRTAILINAALPLSEPNAVSTSWLLSVDVASREMRRIVAIERDGRAVYRVRWSRDGQRLLTQWRDAIAPSGNYGADLNANRRADASSQAQDQHTGLIAYALRAGRWEQVALEAEDTAPAPWVQPLYSQIELQNAQGARNHESYGSSWLEFLPPQALRFSSGLELTLDESVNSPQRIIASIGGRQMELIGPDPVLANIELAPTQILSWRTPDGRTHRGELTLPSERFAGPTPLVINLYHITPNVFRPDGHVASVCPRQLLAERGIAVLEVAAYDTMPLAISDVEGTEAEIDRTLENLDAAIAATGQTGRIDTARVGIIGFSHSTFLARQALLHHGRFPIAAVAANDGVRYALEDLYYSIARFGHADNGLVRDMLVSNRGSPWGTHQRWSERAVELAANRANGALLEVTHSEQKFEQLRLAQSVLGPFLLARRPVEALAVTEDSHVLERPRARAASLMANADWMDFWLQGHEDPDPAKAEMYVRWRQMRTNWDRQRAWEAAGHEAGSEPSADFLRR